MAEAKRETWYRADVDDETKEVIIVRKRTLKCPEGFCYSEADARADLRQRLAESGEPQPSTEGSQPEEPKVTVAEEPKASPDEEPKGFVPVPEVSLAPPAQAEVNAFVGKEILPAEDGTDTGKVIRALHRLTGTVGVVDKDAHGFFGLRTIASEARVSHQTARSILEKMCRQRKALSRDRHGRFRLP